MGPEIKGDEINLKSAEGRIRRAKWTGRKFLQSFHLITCSTILTGLSTILSSRKRDIVGLSGVFKVSGEIP
jgi:hypothetical protein